MSSNLNSSTDDDLPSISFSTHLDRLMLRTHLPSDNEPMAALLSSPSVMKHLPTLAPYDGWPPDRPKGSWLISDMAARAAVHHQTRRETRSCVLYIVTKDTGDFLGSTGFVRMEPAGTPGRKAELGIILTVDEKWARRGYATEAMHGSVKYAFEELEGVAVITIVTDILNEEMRGWADKVAGLKVKEVIDDSVWYSFTRVEWEDKGGVCERLEIKLDKYR